MPWPSSTDYNEAIQNPQYCFSDPELRHGRPALNAMGLPWPRSGNNADVYQVFSPSNKAWAVKCFTREVHGLHERYQAISDLLQQKKLPFMVRFQYLDQGIRIQGQWYPVVKMSWVEGLTLNELINQFIDKPLIIDRLSQLWLRLAQEMAAARIVHGDLQHDNVLLVPRKNLTKLKLRLIDYDGLIVPSLADRPSGERGHRNYQHPARTASGPADIYADRFSHLVIYTAFRALVQGGRSLWQKFDSGDNLLFREQDFQKPGDSALFHDLLAMKDPVVRSLAAQLMAACQGLMNHVPLLHQLFATEVSPAAPAQRAREDAAVPVGYPPMPATLVTVVDNPDDDDDADSEDGLDGKNRVLRLGDRTLPPPPPAPLAGHDRWGADHPPWNLRTVGLLVIGIFGIVLLALTAGLMARSLTAMAPSPSVPSQPGVAVKQLSGPQLLPLREIAVEVGDNRIKVDIQRNGHPGELTLQLAGLPENLSCPAVRLPPGTESAELLITAPLETVKLERQVILTLHDQQKAIGRQTLPFRVLRPSVAQMTCFPDDLFLVPGTMQTFELFLQRKGYQGPIDLRVEGLPTALGCPPGLIFSGESKTTLALSCSQHLTEDWSGGFTVIASVGPYEVFRRRLRAKVVLPPRDLRLLPLPNLTIQAGRKEKIQVTVDRQGWIGPVVIQVKGLPPGVTCPPVTLPDTLTLAALDLTAAANVPPGTQNVQVVPIVGTWSYVAQPFQLTVNPADPRK